MGRPKFQPTQEQRELVTALARIGTRQDIIAGLVKDSRDRPISGPTLRRAFRAELDQAEVIANARVAASLYQTATDPRGGMKATVAAIFWCKTRLGWRETQNLDVRTEHTLNVAEVDARLDRAFGCRSLADAELQRIAFDGSLPTDKKN